MAQDSSSIRPFKNEVMRKLLHLPVFLFPAVAVYSQNAAFLFIAILMVGYIGVLVLEKKYQKNVYLFSTVIAFCKRNVKYDLAPLYLALGMMGAIILSEHNSAFYAAYVVAVCDSLAALIGMRYGRFKIFYMNKTYLGSLVFLVLCFLGGLYFFVTILCFADSHVFDVGRDYIDQGVG